MIWWRLELDTWNLVISRHTLNKFLQNRMLAVKGEVRRCDVVATVHRMRIIGCRKSEEKHSINCIFSSFFFSPQRSMLYCVAHWERYAYLKRRYEFISRANNSRCRCRVRAIAVFSQSRSPAKYSERFHGLQIPNAPSISEYPESCILSTS